MNIDKTGVYLTRDGREAEIDYLDDTLARVCGQISNNNLSWKDNGSFASDRERGCDIIKYLRPLPFTNQQIMITLANTILCNVKYVDITSEFDSLARQLAEAVLKELNNE